MSEMSEMFFPEFENSYITDGLNEPGAHVRVSPTDIPAKLVLKYIILKYIILKKTYPSGVLR